MSSRFVEGFGSTKRGGSSRRGVKIDIDDEMNRVNERLSGTAFSAF